MSGKTYSDLCEHKNQIIDEHEGIYICEDCAKVIDNVFIQTYEVNSSNVDIENSNTFF